MTATCRKALDKLIYDMEVNTGIDFFWLDGTVGSCTLADGAGIGNNTMTDAGPKHEICFSTRHAKEALEAIQDEGALGIVQVGDEQLVVIAKPNRHGTVKLSNQFGSVKELEEGLRGTNFGDNVQAKLDGLSEKTRKIEIFQLPKPVFIEDCQQNDDGSVKKMGKAEIWALPSISYASQMKHPNAQDCSGLANMLQTCQRKLMIVPTQFGTLVLPSEWNTECRVQKCRDSGQMCTGGKHCEPL